MAAIHMTLTFAVMLLVIANVQCFLFGWDINARPNAGRGAVDVGIPGVFNVRLGGAGNQQGGGGGAEVRVGDRFGLYVHGHGGRNGGGGASAGIGKPSNNFGNLDENLRQWEGR